MIGTTIGGKYAVVRQLGEGGMGAVYEARHTGTGRRVAVKVITGALDPDLVARFELEAKAAGAIESEHIVQVLDVGRDEALGAPFLVMEYLVGEDLSHLFARLGPIPTDLALRIGVQACLGLEKAHAQGIVHRDIKPANLFLTERDAGELKIKVLDFGIAKMTSTEEVAPIHKKALTRIGSFIGSPLFMSPEQTRGGALDHRTDVWSLGIVLYEALAGRTPFDDTISVGDFVAAVNTRPAPPIRLFAPWVDPAVALAVERALAIDPGQRYQSIAAMAAALSAFLPQGTSIRGSMLASAAPGTPAAAAAAALTVAATPTPMTTVAGGRAPPPYGANPSGLSLLYGGVTTPGMPTPPPPGVTAPGTPVWQGTTPGHPIGAAPLPPMPPLPVIGPKPRRSSGPALAIVAGVLGVALVGSFVVALALGWIGKKKEEPAEPDAPSASVSAPPVDTAAAAAAMAPLVGPWRSEGGVIYDAVSTGRSVELRIREPESLAQSGYVAGDIHFALRALAGETSTFRVLARVRPPPPRGTVYDKTGSRTTCEQAWQEVDGKPLRAELQGDRLVVKSVRLDPPDAAFTRQAGRVVGCAGLAKSPAVEIEVVLNRGAGPAPTPKVVVWIKPDAGAPVDAGTPPVDAGAPRGDAGAPRVDAGVPPVVDAGGPLDQLVGRPVGSLCRRDGHCASSNCTNRRCEGNTPGSRCIHNGHCASRSCQGGVCR